MIWATIHVGIDIPKQHAVHQDPSGWPDVLWLRSSARGRPRHAPSAEDVGAEAAPGGKPQRPLPYAEARDLVNLQYPLRVHEKERRMRLPVRVAVPVSVALPPLAPA